MKIDIEINNLTENFTDIQFIEKMAKKILKKKNFDYLDKKNIFLSIALVSEKEIKKINRVYRKKDFITDVLSFAEFKTEREIKNSKDKIVFLGEIILCYNDIKKYAEKKGVNVKEELAEVVSHGMLHLLGWKHGKKMFAMQRDVKLQDKK